MIAKLNVVVFHPSPNLVQMIDDLLLPQADILQFKNVIKPDLLNCAIKDGINANIIKEIEDVISNTDKSDFVLCTCSTLGGSAEDVGRKLGRTVMRIDRPMAELAIKTGRKIGIAAALNSTLEPTRQLLVNVANELGVSIETSFLLCEEAWRKKQNGDNSGYITDIVKYLESAYHGFDVIVLAQGSMAPAKEKLSHLTVPVISSPEAAIDRVIRIAKEM